MRTTLIVSIVAACGSPSAGVSLESGPLIAISEGDPPHHIHVSGATKLTTDVTWATFDSASGDLVLDPPCTTVPGTSGAPRLFYMQLDSTAIVVQVQPSAAGSCAPTLLGCSTGACTQTFSCMTDQIGHGPIALRYPQLTDADQAITFSVVNPDPAVGLAVHVTTDAPLKFKQDQSSTSVCAQAPNTNIVGSFTIDWGIAESPGSEGAPLVASGEYRFDWNVNDDFGLETQWCAGETDQCALHRYTSNPQLPDNAQWCIDTKNHGAIPMTLGLRLWFQPMAGDTTGANFDVTAMLKSGNPVNLTSSSARAAGHIMIVVDRDSVPGVLTADLGMVGTDTLTLTTGLSVPDSKSMRIAIMPTCPTLNEQLNATAPR